MEETLWGDSPTVSHPEPLHMSEKSAMVIGQLAVPIRSSRWLLLYVGVRQLDQKLCQQIEPPTIGQPAESKISVS
jgi:hypothetical protein